MNTSAKKLDYIPGLDGIRALAALLVVSTHWTDNKLSLKFGWIGVNIFFVLSGFLITRILVNEKHREFKPYLSRFFYKRVLRIVPVYYLFFGVTAIIILSLYWFVPNLAKNDLVLGGITSLKKDTPYYLTYLYNLRLNLSPFFNWGAVQSRLFGHSWSLSVEEQFYLAYPFIVYFAGINTLKKIVIAMIIICPLMRLWAATIGSHVIKDMDWLGELMYTNTICQADALATGAALALFSIKIKFPYRTFFTVAIIWFAVGMVCFISLRKAGYFQVAGKSFGYDYPGFWFSEKTPWAIINIRAFYQYTLVNMLAFALIAPATIKKPLFPILLQARPVVYLGKISYGIYLFHAPVLVLFMIGATYFGGWIALTQGYFTDIIIFIVYLSVVITLAHLSYKYFERKIINSYKPA